MNSGQQLYIYGRRPVYEALRSAHTVFQVFLAENSSGKIIGKIKQQCTKKQVPFDLIPKNDLQKLVGPVVHQGVAALIEFNPFLSREAWQKLIEQKPDALLLITDQIQDAHNLGAILRTCEISGVDCVVLPSKGSAPLNATVAKTSSGALFHVQFHTADSLENSLVHLQDNDFSVFATLPSAEQTIYQADFTGKTALIIGSEDKGVRKNLLPYCTHAVKIPQFGHVNSLNASVSAAIVLYEAVRQRYFAGQAPNGNQMEKA